MAINYSFGNGGATARTDAPDLTQYMQGFQAQMAPPMAPRLGPRTPGLIIPPSQKDPTAERNLARARANTMPTAADKYAAALRPRHAFGSGALHYELADSAMGDPDIRATLPSGATMIESGDPGRGSPVGKAQPSDYDKYLSSIEDRKRRSSFYSGTD